MKRLLARFLLAAGAMLLSVTSYGQIAINSVPYTITSSGNYILNKDLFFNATKGTAISINSSDVTLDFAGYVLQDGLGTLAGANVTGVALATNNLNIVNVTIQNGTIRGFQTGIFLAGLSKGQSSTGHVVQGMRIFAPNQESTVGIDPGSAQGCLISNNFVNNAGIGIGSFNNFNHCEFLHNRVINCNVGFETSVNTQVGNYFESNFASNGLFGFILSGDKIRFNTTQDCTTPFDNGVNVNDGNF